MISRVPLIVLVLAGVGCVTPLKRGDTLAVAEQPGPAPQSKAADAPSLPPSVTVLATSPTVLAEVATQIEFEHGCPPDRVRFIRGFEGRSYGLEGRCYPLAASVDLDVCGAVRRYQRVAGSWLDVTALFPAGALPAPLPPARKEAASQ